MTWMNLPLTQQSSSKTTARAALALSTFAIVGLVVFTGSTPAKQASCTSPTYDIDSVDWPAVTSAIKGWLSENHEYTPILLRLSWHDSGTYKKSDDSGGSRGAQRFLAGESQHGANAGLHIARGIVQMFKESFPAVGYADLWALTAVLAIKEAGGPTIAFRAGRSDIKSAAECVEEGRLPDGDKGASHVRTVFYRMGFTDQEIVALSGGHTLGACHADRSGFGTKPWTTQSTTFSNEYFSLLLECDWKSAKSSTGLPQMACDSKPELMMLTTDYALVTDDAFRPHVEAYAKDNDLFAADFAKAFQKLQENGHAGLVAVDLD